MKKSHKKTHKSLGATRWPPRDDACQRLLIHWEQILSALKMTSEDPSLKSQTRAEANGLFKKIKTLETAILVQFWGFFLHCLNATNKWFQAIKTDLTSVVNLLSMSLQPLGDTNKRKEDEIGEANSDAELTVSWKKKFEVDVFNVLTDRLLSEHRKRKKAYSKVYKTFIYSTDIHFIHPSNSFPWIHTYPGIHTGFKKVKTSKLKSLHCKRNFWRISQLILQKYRKINRSIVLFIIHGCT